MTADELNDWFLQEVLPLEGLLEAYLRRNWRDADEIADLRQEVYAAEPAIEPDRIDRILANLIDNDLLIP